MGLVRRQGKSWKAWVFGRLANWRQVLLSLPVVVSEGRDIGRFAGECLKRVPLSQRIRLLGVRAGGLERLNVANATLAVQAELFF